MRISIWQQFSSNNSSGYVIVGQFNSERQAKAATETLRSVFRRMRDWYEAHPTDRENAQALDCPPTGAERIVSDEYEIEFKVAIDWVAAEQSPDFITDAITTFENYVYIAVLDETLTHDTPFVQLMRKLGANIKHEEKLDAQLYVSITGVAPDITTAQYIRAICEAYLTRNRGSNFIATGRAPWAAFYDGQLASDLEQLNDQINLYLAHEQAQFAWSRTNGERQNDLHQRLMEARRTGNQLALTELEQKWQALWAEYYRIESGLSPDEYDQIEKLLDRVFAEELNDDEVQVEIEGLRVNIRKMWFLDRSLGYGLPAVVTWMRSLGCHNVDYEFVSVPYSWMRKSE